MNVDGAQTKAILDLTMSFSLENPNVKLVLIAIASSLVTFAAQRAWNERAHLKKNREQLGAELMERYHGPQAHLDEDAKILDYNEELIREQLARTYAFFGEAGMERIRNGYVVIVGCGGVGSWAAIMLART